jgi:hypothetical protein
MRPLGFVTGGVVVVLAILWVARAYRDLAFLRAEVQGAWTQLRNELDSRREIIPYLLGGVHVKAPQMAEIIGNACDLAAAAHAAGVREFAQAEGRLTAALAKFFALVDGDPELRDDASVVDLRRKLAGVELAITVLREAYNIQVRALNARLESGLGRLFGQLPSFRRPELF